MGIACLIAAIPLLTYFFGPNGRRRADDDDSSVPAGATTTVVFECSWGGNGVYDTSGTGQFLKITNITDAPKYAWRNFDFSSSNGPDLFFFRSADASYDASDTQIFLPSTTNGEAMLSGDFDFALEGVEADDDVKAMILYCTLGFTFGTCVME